MSSGSASTPRAIAVVPPTAEIEAAVVAAGARLVEPAAADGLVWLGAEPATLDAVLDGAPRTGWVQLPWAGVESYLPIMDDGRVWTRADGVYGRPVAEHALMLAMVALRRADRSARLGRWAPQPPQQLSGEPVLVVGGGAIATELLRLLAPFGCACTVVRRSGAVLPDLPDVRVRPPGALDEELARARVVVLAVASTPETAGLIDARRLALMRLDACLVNVARGGLVVTADLVAALAGGVIAGAALDVTDPEPLPAGHPLWDAPNCFVTAHCADDLPWALDRLADLVRHNVARWTAGEKLVGVVDTARGY